MCQREEHNIGAHFLIRAPGASPWTLWLGCCLPKPPDGLVRRGNPTPFAQDQNLVEQYGVFLQGLPRKVGNTRQDLCPLSPVTSHKLEGLSGPVTGVAPHPFFISSVVASLDMRCITDNGDRPRPREHCSVGCPRPGCLVRGSR